MYISYIYIYYIYFNFYNIIIISDIKYQIISYLKYRPDYDYVTMCHMQSFYLHKNARYTKILRQRGTRKSSGDPSEKVVAKHSLATSKQDSNLMVQDTDE